MMAYRLALAMGRIDVDKMLSEMTAADFQGWIGYYAIEPWGGGPERLRAGMQAWLTHTGSPLFEKKLDLEKFMIPESLTPTPPRVQSTEQAWAMLTSVLKPGTGKGNGNRS